MILVESSGLDDQYHEESGATGPLQIKQILVDDANRIIGKPHWYTLQDCHSLTDSIEIFHIIKDHYATEELLGHKPTMRDRAGIWKQGFASYKRNPHESNPYWNKVVGYVEKLK